jgi:hypothetical protein
MQKKTRRQDHLAQFKNDKILNYNLYHNIDPKNVVGKIMKQIWVLEEHIDKLERRLAEIERA